MVSILKTLIKKKFFPVDILIYFDGSNDGLKIYTN